MYKKILEADVHFNSSKQLDLGSLVDTFIVEKIFSGQWYSMDHVSSELSEIGIELTSQGIMKLGDMLLSYLPDLAVDAYLHSMDIPDDERKKIEELYSKNKFVEACILVYEALGKRLTPEQFVGIGTAFLHERYKNHTTEVKINAIHAFQIAGRDDLVQTVWDKIHPYDKENVEYFLKNDKPDLDKFLREKGYRQ